VTAGTVFVAGLLALAGLGVIGAVLDRVRHRAPGQPSTVARLLLALVGFYRRFVSPALPPSCRFTPSCSAYAVEALSRHGAARGSWLTLRRLLRCGPWHSGGHDPVPPVVGRSEDAADLRPGCPASPEAAAHVPSVPSTSTGATRC
jgi:putative membrane protein insertion efficiency factor